MKYRKKPVVIEAIEFNRENIALLQNFMSSGVRNAMISLSGSSLPLTLKMEIDTLEGVMTASEGDFIIKGITGEFYPCKPDIFMKTYDPIEED